MAAFPTKPDQRAWPRRGCGVEGVYVAEGVECPTTMIDASRGGFKLRFSQPDGPMATLAVLPCDVKVATEGHTHTATVMWARDGLAGCRFYQHLSLDDVVLIATRPFRIERG
jgi:hypothetical protein